MEQDWQPSFFNLSVELMLEGLENAPFCDTYRYHAERGYGTIYQTQVGRCSSRESLLHSTSLLRYGGWWCCYYCCCYYWYSLLYLHIMHAILLYATARVKQCMRRLSS